jgi:hypothetical protein
MELFANVSPFLPIYRSLAVIAADKLQRFSSGDMKAARIIISLNSLPHHGKHPE